MPEHMARYWLYDSRQRHELIGHKTLTMTKDIGQGQDGYQLRFIQQLVI